MPFDSLPGMTDEEINRIAPSVFAPHPMPGVSERYIYLPTHTVIHQLRERGLQVTQVREGKSRIAGRKPFIMHEVRMEPASNLYAPQTRELGTLSPQLVLLNSHNRTTAFTMLAGLLRGLCHNGMFWGTDMIGFRAMHSRVKMDQVTDGAFQIVDRFGQIVEQSANWRKIEVPRPRQLEFAAKAVEIRGTSMKVDPEEVLKPRRAEDHTNNLWGMFNTVQENLTRGGSPAQGSTGKWRALAPVKSLKPDVDMNKKLWTLAHELAEAA